MCLISDHFDHQLSGSSENEQVVVKEKPKKNQPKRKKAKNIVSENESEVSENRSYKTDPDFTIDKAKAIGKVKKVKSDRKKSTTKQDPSKLDGIP